MLQHPRLRDAQLEAMLPYTQLLFRPGSTQFLEDPQLTAPYPMWIEQIATRVAQANTCLEIVGHTSPKGPVQRNARKPR